MVQNETVFRKKEVQAHMEVLKAVSDNQSDNDDSMFAGKSVSAE